MKLIINFKKQNDKVAHIQLPTPFAASRMIIYLKALKLSAPKYNVKNLTFLSVFQFLAHKCHLGDYFLQRHYVFKTCRWVLGFRGSNSERKSRFQTEAHLKTLFTVQERFAEFLKTLIKKIILILQIFFFALRCSLVNVGFQVV